MRKKRGDDSLIKVDINSNIFFNKNSAVETYLDAIDFIVKSIPYQKMCEDFNTYFTTSEIFTHMIQKKGSTKRDRGNQFLLNVNTSSERKGSMLDKVLSNYNFDYKIEVVDKKTLNVIKSFSSDNTTKKEKTITVVKHIEELFVKNPFGGDFEKSAICVTGDSGAGKSYRVEKTLSKNNHNFIFETYDPTSTGILTQYIGSGIYERNNVGDFIVKAKTDPINYYTIVLDECHKDGFIDRINSELLQCFSTKRNDGLRFFSTNKSTDNLFVSLEQKNGRRVVPDNVGFILITSKPDIIENNDDIKNRVDIINLREEDRKKDFDIKYLIKSEKIFVEQFENQD